MLFLGIVTFVGTLLLLVVDHKSVKPTAGCESRQWLPRLHNTNKTETN